MYELAVCNQCGYKKFLENGTRIVKKCPECGENLDYQIFCDLEKEDITDIIELTPLESFLIWVLLIGGSLLVWIALIKQVISLIW